MRRSAWHATPGGAWRPIRCGRIPEVELYALIWLLPLSLALAGGGLLLFLWCVRAGQFEDLDGAAWRILQDDEPRGGGGRSGREANDRQG